MIDKEDTYEHRPIDLSGPVWVNVWEMGFCVCASLKIRAARIRRTKIRKRKIRAARIRTRNDNEKK
jgi:hypothetical protein